MKYCIIILFCSFICFNVSFEINADYNVLCKTETNSPSVVITCKVDNNSEWVLYTFTKWISNFNVENKSIILNISCANGEGVNIQSRTRINWLKSIDINGCSVKGYLNNEFVLKNHSDGELSGELDMLDRWILRNSFVLIKRSTIWKNHKLFNASCELHTLLDVYIIRNVSFETNFDVNLSREQVIEIEKYTNAITNLCQYKNLRYFEISYCRTDYVKSRIKNIFSYSIFPLLNTINLSMNMLDTLPKAIHSEFWMKMFPVLKTFDLSGNNLHAIDFLSGARSFLSTYQVKVKIGNNKIKSLSRHDFVTLMQFYPHILIDFRKISYIKCLCDETSPKESLQGLSTTKMGQNYSYLIKMCTPECTDISKDANDKTFPTVSMIAIVVIIIGITLSLSWITFIIRRKIVKRKHVTLNCPNRAKTKCPPFMTYDAFISYNSRDERWVYDTLVHNLETNISGIRICLHHKNFIPGATIAENIINSIEESRHTLVILSENFIKSEWCHMEFQKAFSQTLKHKGHLLLILLEDVDINRLDQGMTYFVKTYNFLKVSELLFWSKLYHALGK